ncbi:hypothetical protein S7711_04561 [Stachybotrys chartarum IBT 7711]|uniref:Trafficking protein particle complex subunit 6B n=1 Tax=Stachybotrys chartarum (strain CBS 109288 / IBT 7711) TaxID=1280523 RepID=A0A084APT0_STACB|nr:hypothetical protein S7711_04561 [Stachybotrys chartarum IBT 7711]KFA75300.1 hypothetical protein S40288_00238 [Stachybotrys chartarum IBT 40288]
MSFDAVMPPYNSSDPGASFLSSSCLDFLLIELVPLAHRVAYDRDAPLLSAEPVATTPTATAAAASVAPSSSTAATGTQHQQRRLEDDEELDAVQYRLDMLGYRVGQGLVERFSRDRPRFNDTLDVIKFVCKDLWSLVFGKNIDNLKTNHRVCPSLCSAPLLLLGTCIYTDPETFLKGVYVLTDNVFRPFSRMSTEAGGQAVVRAQPFLWFPCGIVRGALAALGIVAIVQAEIHELPGAVFQIKTAPVK